MCSAAGTRRNSCCKSEETCNNGLYSTRKDRKDLTNKIDTARER